jgi:hypothetical protein
MRALDKAADDPRTRSLWAEFFLSRVLVFVVSRENYGDMHAYFDGVLRLVSKGSPYGADGFGYPALAFLFVSIPWILGGKTFQLYYPLYRAQCFVIDVVVFLLLSRRCTRSSLLVYIVCTTLLGNLLYHRLDILLGCLLFLALLLEARGQWKLAALTLGASIAFKIIPLLLVPAWLASAMRRSLKEAFGALGFVALGAAGPMAVACSLWGGDALFFLSGHAERGVQIESTWASVEIALMPFGLEGKTYMGSGSFNLSTPLEPLFTRLAQVVAAAAGLWGAVVASRLALRRGPLVLAAASTLGACMLAGHVFSPQFLLFFLPMLMWASDSMGPTLRRVTMGLAFGCCALTTWVYPYHERDLVALMPVATVPLVARNVTFAFLVVLLQVHAWQMGRPQNRAAVNEEPGRQSRTEEAR